MLNDIKNTPEVIKKLLDKHIGCSEKIQGINLEFKELSKIYIVASGSSRNAGSVAKNFIEYVAKIPVFVEFASEFANREPFLTDNDLVVFVSQSGETADVKAALKIAGEKNAVTFAITNKENSSIDKLASASILVMAGEEECVPATKTFSGQLLCLYLLGIFLAEKRKSLSVEELKTFKDKLFLIPQVISNFLDNSGQVIPVAEKIKDARGIIILGRGENYGLAEEAALKIKETSYINAAGYPTGEFLHGHLALLDRDFSLISIVLPTLSGANNYKFSKKNTNKIFDRRKPKTVVIKLNSDCNDFNNEFGFINIFTEDVLLQPFEVSVAIQLLTFEIAKLLGRDVKNPRSLSKIVYEQ